MCASDTIRYLCGHHCRIARIRKCPLTLASINFKQCSIVGEWYMYVHENCTACARAAWNKHILENEEEQRRRHELAQREYVMVDQYERSENHSTNTKMGNQTAKQMLPEHHQRGVFQNMNELTLGNLEQRCVLSENSIKLEIFEDLAGYAHYGWAASQPAVEMNTQRVLRCGRIIQWGDMEPIPYFPEYDNTAGRSEDGKVKAGLMVSREFNPHSDSSSTTTATEYLSYSSQGSNLACFFAGEVYQRNQVDEDESENTPIVISNVMSRPRSKSCPSILVHDGSILQVCEN